MTRPRSKGSQGRGKDADGRRLRIALAQFPARMGRAIRLFRQLTGFTAVTSLRAAMDDPSGTDGITPPVHPRCAMQLRRTKLEAPCEEQWQWHLQTGLRTHSAHSHVCPLGLRCSCVPIFYGKTLVGTAKVVAGPETTESQFSLAAQALDLAVSSVCQEFYVSALTEELENLRTKVAGFRKVRRGARAEAEGDQPTAEARTGHAPAAHDGSLMDQVLGYLGAHYLDPTLSLTDVSRALEVNGKYLTRVFSRVVGQHMRTYILDLRVHHACRLLLSNDRPIKAVAVESGFRRPERFGRVFRARVGVTPAAYRRIFTTA